MKKLFTLIVVLYFASFSSAAFVFPESASDTISIDTDAPIWGYDIGLVVISGDVSRDDVEVVFNPDFDWYFPASVVGSDLLVPWSPEKEIRLTASQWDEPDLGPGNLFIINGITGQGSVQVINYLYDTDNPWTYEILGTIQVVPEPATLLLMGLGGVLLKRKAG